MDNYKVSFEDGRYWVYKNNKTWIAANNEEALKEFLSFVILSTYKKDPVEIDDDIINTDLTINWDEENEIVELKKR